MNDEPTEPRLVTVSRRTFLRRSVAAGALLTIPGLACGNDDAEVFAADDSSTTPTEGPLATPTTAAVEPTAPPPTAEPEADASAAAGQSLPPGTELEVAFTYEPDSGGRVLNPYVAVWVEDAEGTLVDTISLWYLQSQKGTRWLNDLARWYAASNQAADTTMSGATRVAGSYTVAWDATDLTGAPILQGDYTLYIEAAREHGPYSITSAPLTIGDTPFTIALPDDGEIRSASAELVL